MGICEVEIEYERWDHQTNLSFLTRRTIFFDTQSKNVNDLLSSDKYLNGSHHTKGRYPSNLYSGTKYLFHFNLHILRIHQKNHPSFDISGWFGPILSGVEELYQPPMSGSHTERPIHHEIDTYES